MLAHGSTYIRELYLRLHVNPASSSFILLSYAEYGAKQERIVSSAKVGSTTK